MKRVVLAALGLAAAFVAGVLLVVWASSEEMEEWLQ